MNMLGFSIVACFTVATRAPIHALTQAIAATNTQCPANFAVRFMMFLHFGELGCGRLPGQDRIRFLLPNSTITGSSRYTGITSDLASGRIWGFAGSFQHSGLCDPHRTRGGWSIRTACAKTQALLNVSSTN
jgi:hypothetical protein